MGGIGRVLGRPGMDRVPVFPPWLDSHRALVCTEGNDYARHATPPCPHAVEVTRQVGRETEQGIQLLL